MLRALIVILVLANIGFYAWTQGWLTGIVGVAPSTLHEPARLSQQVNPQNITLLPPQAHAASGASSPGSDSVSRAASSAPAAPSSSAGAEPAASRVAVNAAKGQLACMQLGPLTEAERAALAQVARKSLPQLVWTETRADKKGLWLIYMGRYASQDMLEKKEEELQRIHVVFEEMLTPPDLRYGLSLGRFDDRGEANGALNRLAARGIHTARLVMLRPPQITYTLRFPNVSDGDRGQLEQWARDTADQSLIACPAGA